MQRARQAGAPPPALGFPVFVGTRAWDTEIPRLVWREQSAQRLGPTAASLRLLSRREPRGPKAAPSRCGSPAQMGQAGAAQAALANRKPTLQTRRSLIFRFPI